MQRILWCGAIGAAAAAAGAGAPVYSIEQSTIDGGGGALVGTTHTLTGTIGQPDAADALVGTTYELEGGFWMAAPPACPGDANGDGAVNFEDLNLVLGSWGGAGPDGDVDGSGAVNFEDLNIVLGNWAGDC